MIFSGCVIFAQPDTLSNNIYQDNGKMGIGISSPNYLLHLKGYYTADERYLMRLENTNDTWLSYCSMKISSGTDGYVTTLGHYASNYTGTGGAAGYGILNSTGAGLMLNATAGTEPRVIKFCNGIDGNGHIERMRIDTSGFVGIGTNEPRFKLHIRDINSQLFFGYQPAYDGPYINLIGEVAGETPMLGIGLAQKDYEYNGTILAKEDWAYLYGNIYNKGIAIIPDLVLAPAGLFVDKYGFVGVGIDVPVSKFQVADGDIFLSSIERGIIMKSPDDKCWRGTLDNSGNLNFAEVDCPDKSTSETPGIAYPDSESGHYVKIFPNPSKDIITIAIEGVNRINYRYIIYDLSGQEVKNGAINSAFSGVDLDALNNGRYILTIMDQNDTLIKSEKIVKK